MTAPSNEFIVMTSGAFTAAHLALVPQLERMTQKKVVTATTSVGTGENAIPNRLKRGEIADLVIVADALLQQLIDEGLVLRDSRTPVARSTIGIAVRAGAPKPDLSSVDGLRRTLLDAKSIAYSASVSGQYLTGELLQRLGIADAVSGKCRFVGGGERTGAVVARGDADIAFQQMSELLPVAGHRTYHAAAAGGSEGVALSPPVSARTRAMRISPAASSDSSASAEAAPAITQSGLEPVNKG